MGNALQFITQQTTPGGHSAARKHRRANKMTERRTKPRTQADVAFHRLPEPAKTESLNLRVTPETKNRLSVLAAVEHKTVSRYVDEKLSAFCRSTEADDFDAVDFLPCLILMARFLHGEIEPCRNADRTLKTWSECVTVDNGKIRLWYNSCSTKSTHLITVTHSAFAPDTVIGGQP